MKKIISAILTLILATTCLFSATVVTSAADTAIPDGLVMAYDFEGDESIAFKDKATGGVAVDDLTTYTENLAGLDKIADYTIENGVLNVGKLTKFRSPAKSADFQNITAYTVYLKIKVTGDYAGDWISLMTINQLFRVYISAESDGAYTVQVRDGMTAAAEQKPINGIGFKKDQWLHLAYTLEIGSNGATANHYISTDGTNYQVESRSVDLKAALNQTSLTEFGWNKKSDTIHTSYDDIFVFNRALSANEIKTLASVDLPAPVVEPEDTTPADTTPADTTPKDTTPADTTPKDTTPKDTTPAATTPAATTPTSDTEAEKEDGCGAALGFGSAIVAVSALGIAVCAKKRKDD